METFKNFRPTEFDTRGKGATSHNSEWLVSPCIRTRDSDALERSNWDTIEQALSEIDPNESHHEIHRFRHWGPGWFEVVVVKPDSECAKYVQKCITKLESYPVLNEDLMSEYECEDGTCECEAY